jgi:PAS domain S-box-containing protein
VESDLYCRVVLSRCADFIHVLSLKGLFQYVSPSVRRVLEYEPEDLLNKNISDICHPSDIVPLMRELKDSTHAPTEGQSARPVNLVFRIRRKNSGYVWIECSGRLHVEPGKGRKAVILSGRARSVPILQWEAVAQHGGLAETEFWTKVSFEGLILHATSTAEELLGQPADDVIGQSIFSLLPGGDNGPPSPDADPSSPVAKVAAAFRSAVSGTSTSSPVSVQHKMVQKSGTQIDVVTIFYPPKSSTDLHLRSDSDSSSPTSELSRPSSTLSTGDSGIKPISLVVQVKLLPPNTVLEGATTPEFIAGITNARPLAHEGHTNLFEELETTRGTSWQYELHQLRVTNRRIQEQIDTARKEASKSGNKSKLARKRKVGEEMGPPQGGAGSVPEQYNAAPRHQLAPGFGLVTPGMPSPYY